ncbi:uncharacterized protein Z518_11125 [Rhinocladiella mackenziei CBS 650.93]|uniref:Uncharacterized protein n=1 Tax=Rhinocladiella mackenziei CBS 650.93 TaxID=1442369 RepID=A0A0D2GMX4_9EURO|nr:uncharacterized protein Z518_11125 [Rhinocladiella mackenziei CBS 650.93]KIW99712.1 hypothetical protein Z518_11125 [Rhinocladiella mackenziei CBS 650.93]
MSRKRRNTSSPEPDDSSPPKRRNTHDAIDDGDDWGEEDGKEVPQVDEYSGQTGAFPGLGMDRDEIFYGPASDGIDYLRMVRSEAKGVPRILTAPGGRTEDVEGEQEEEGGYYHDGAYTAVTRAPPVEAESIPPSQQHYYDSLLAQFKLVQATMRCTPPLRNIQNLQSSQLISFPEGSRKARMQWEAHMLSSDPHPVQIACMDSDTVLELVRFLKRKLHRFLQQRDESGTVRIGAWIWAVLGKCRHPGELSSEEIGELRELAQRAVEIQEGRNEEEDAAGDEDLEFEGLIEEDAAGRGNAGGSRAVVSPLPESMEAGDTDTQYDQGAKEDLDRARLMRTTLDMIITVVGEIYGQRDLLDLRMKWVDDQ